MRDTPAFARFWLAATTSSLGNGIRTAALPLLAASLDPRPLFVALVAACGTLPWLLLGLPAGVLVDRVPRRPLLIAMHVVRGAAGLEVAITVGTGQVTPVEIVVFAALLGIGDVLADLSAHALLPAMVEDDDLEWANGRLVSAELATFEFAGPALGGLLFAAGVHLPIAVDAVTFLLAAGLLVRWTRGAAWDAVRRPDGDRPDAVVRPWRGLGAEVAEGVRWFVRAPFIRSLSLLSATVNLGLGGLYGVLVLLATGPLGLGPTGYGLLLSVSAIGGFAAGLAVDRLPEGSSHPDRGTRRTLLVLTPPAVAGCLALTAGARHVGVAAVALVLTSAIVTWFNVVAMSARQATIPDHLLGRVLSVHRLFVWGALPLGALLAGAVAARADARAGILACAGVIVLAWLAVLPGMRAQAAPYAV